MARCTRIARVSSPRPPETVLLGITTSSPRLPVQDLEGAAPLDRSQVPGLACLLKLDEDLQRFLPHKPA